MRPVLSREQMREFDGAWIERGVPGIVLMENAGRGAAHLIGLKVRPRLPGEKPRQGSSVVGSCVRCADERSLAGVSVLILAGTGNNGGDAFVVARHLAARAAHVSVWGLSPGNQLKGDARLAFEAMEAVGVRLEALPPQSEWPAALARSDLIVDGLLGTGAARSVEGRLAQLIEAVNLSKTQVIALDIPSGLDAETGAVLGRALSATHTVTFAHLKKGLLTTHGHAHAGNITVSHIGVPAELPAGMEPAAWLLERSDLSAALSLRSRTAHKGTAGRLVVVAGSPGTLGAARLSSRACLRAGAGLVTLLTDPATVAQLESEVVEVMTSSFEDVGAAQVLGAADAMVVGPGLGKGSAARCACEAVWKKGCPTVVDADALRLVAEDRTAFLSQPERLFVLTPHPGEAAALLATSIEEVEADRFFAAQRLSEELSSVVVLKGPRTIIAAPGMTPVVSAFGSPALATAGSGDVLSGIVGAFLVGARTTEDVFRRAQAGVGVHALCGERWESQHGDRGLLASELADLVPEVIAELLA